MTQFLIDFTWQKPRASAIFELVAVKPPSRPKVIVYPRQGKGRRAPLGPADLPLLDGQWGFAYHPLGIAVLPLVLPPPSGKDARPHCIRLHNGQREEDLESYRPLEAFGSVLLTQFLRIETLSDVLDFVRRFGPLTAAGLDPRVGDLAEGVVAHAGAMREFLAVGGLRSRAAKAYLDGAQASPFAELEVTLAFDPGGNGPRLRFMPGSLLDAIWFQAAQKLLSGTVVRRCGHCDEPFEAGPGTRRRLDAKFCSDEHKVAFNSLKRTREK